MDIENRQAQRNEGLGRNMAGHAKLLISGKTMCFDDCTVLHIMYCIQVKSRQCDSVVLMTDKILQAMETQARK